MKRSKTLHYWNRATLNQNSDWKIRVDKTRARGLDELLKRTAEQRISPSESELDASLSVQPGFDELITRARAALGPEGPGIAWLQGLPTTEAAARLGYLAIGRGLGEPLDNYGVLYDVRDQGGSYLDKPIPVSQTRYTTSFHTDSARKETLPRIVGLLCLQDAVGGDNQLASASWVHERMDQEAPGLLARLYRDYIRDIVTPGTEPTAEALLANRFPVFQKRDHGRALTLRYMRYWIEKGHEQMAQPLDPLDIQAFDVLDQTLNDPRFCHDFAMAPGDMLFIDNHKTAHDREAYEDDPQVPRLMIRLWLNAI